MEMMRAVIYKGKDKIAVEEKKKPVPREGEVLIKVAYTGICGTDLNIYQGAHPRAKAPLVIGHELTGTIEGDFGELSNGTRVTVRPLISCGICPPCKTGNSHVCQSLKLYGIDTDGAFAEYIKVDKDKVHIIPEGVDLKLAAFAEPMAVGVHAVESINISRGDKVVVYGAGTIGLATAAAIKLLKTNNIMIVETNPFRLKTAKELGFVVVDAMSCDVNKEIFNFTKGNGADAVFDCAGSQAVSKQLSKVTKVKGDIVIVAAYKKPAPINLLEIMFKEIKLRGVRVYTSKDFDIALELLNKEFKFDKMLTHTLKPEDIQAGFDILLSGGDAIKVLCEF